MNRANFKSLTNLTYSNASKNLIVENYDNSKFELTDEEVKQRVQMLTNQTLCSSKRMLNYCERSEIFGYNTTRNLTYQDEKLKNIQKDINQIDRGLNDVEENLNKLKSSCCCFNLKPLILLIFCCCRIKKKQKKKKNKSFISVAISKGKLSQTTGDSSESDNVSVLHSSSNESAKKFTLKRMLSAKSLSSLKNENLKSFINRIRLRKVDSTVSTVSKYKKNKSLKSLNTTNSEEDYVETINDANEKLNKNLKNIFYKLDDLQTMASDIGTMINKQNDKITNMDKRTDLAVSKVKSADKIGKSICKTKKKKSNRSLVQSKSAKSILTFKN